ncbi:MAG: T9SS type A sorting domain-containing protein [bacterium]|nr:T9SS type A sorting domain-containing protein [bacterium]
MKSLFLSAAVCLFISAVVPATSQPGDRPKKHADCKELRTEMRAWFERSVKPTLLDWKRDYDASLSSEDLATLNQLRAEASAHRKQWAQHKKDHKVDGRHERHSDADREARHAARRAFFERLKPIAERSKEKLVSIFENGKDNIETWKEQAKTIMAKWRDEHPEARKGSGHHHGIGPMGIDFGHGHHGKRAAIRFMLWDGTIPTEDEGRFGAEAAPTDINEVGTTQMSPLRIAPLPSENTAALTMQVMENGPATIEIFSMDGVLMKSVQVVVTGNTLNERIDVSALPTGTYMASVNTTAGRRTRQIVVSR